MFNTLCSLPIAAKMILITGFPLELDQAKYIVQVLILFSEYNEEPQRN